MHLTLVFLGDLNDGQLDELHMQLSAIRAKRFDLCVAGLDVFGGDRPRQVHAVPHRCEALDMLQAAVVRAARRAGLTPERRRFRPHITLARLNLQADFAAIGRFVATRAVLPGPQFGVDAFHLYSSHLSPKGARYDAMASYPLSE
ncbi:RNA 2',3'-cyclic phosphodiesterase [Escherichia coli]|nr:RNA 2',3'-cyclic phosphodiesterase [Escherichia coli]